MTIHTVKPDSTNHLPTLAKAAAVAQPGDVIIIHAGVYREVLRPPAGTTWQAADGEKVVIDREWAARPMDAADGKATGVVIAEPDVTIRQLEIRNVAGQGVAVTQGGHRFTMEKCQIHHTLQAGFAANGLGEFIEGITIRHCHAHDLCLSGQWQETPVNGCFLFKSARRALVEDCLIERGYGEGLAAGSRSQHIVFRRVTVRNTRHLLVYAANRATDVTVEHCLFYQDGLAAFRQGDGDVGAGIVVGDEESGDKDNQWQHSENVTIRGCLVVNGGITFQLRNGTKPGRQPGALDGYNTRIQNLVVERCTFVTGPDSKLGITIGQNDQGGSVAGVFRNNLFVLDTMRRPDAERFRNRAPGITFENNVWTTAVPAGLQGRGNRQLPAKDALVAPLSTPLALDNYRPVPGGPLDGLGIGADIDAICATSGEPEDPPTDPPGEPDEEPVWFKEFREQVADALARQEGQVDRLEPRLTTLEQQMAYLAALPER
jgi:hypothetical protein